MGKNRQNKRLKIFQIDNKGCRKTNQLQFKNYLMNISMSWKILSAIKQQKVYKDKISFMIETLDKIAWE